MESGDHALTTDDWMNALSCISGISSWWRKTIQVSSFWLQLWQEKACGISSWIKKPFKYEFCDYNCDLKKHLASVQEGEKSLKCVYCIPAVIWKNMWYQFMDKINHSNVKFVITAVTWKSIWDQFMEKRNHSIIKFLITAVMWKSIWYQIMNERCHANVKFVFTPESLCGISSWMT